MNNHILSPVVLESCLVYRSMTQNLGILWGVGVEWIARGCFISDSLTQHHPLLPKQPNSGRKLHVRLKTMLNIFQLPLFTMTVGCRACSGSLYGAMMGPDSSYTHSTATHPHWPIEGDVHRQLLTNRCRYSVSRHVIVKSINCVNNTPAI